MLCVSYPYLSMERIFLRRDSPRRRAPNEASAKLAGGNRS